jgi:hypothetical protein
LIPRLQRKRGPGQDAESQPRRVAQSPPSKVPFDPTVVPEYAQVRTHGLMERGTSDDQSEQRAARMAEGVMRPSGRSSARAVVSRTMQGGTPPPPGPCPPALHGSPGRPLEAPVQVLMESRFGHRFGDVRVHTDRRAAESAALHGAEAYTYGAHVVFAADRHAPATHEGQRLLAHELAHVVQQRTTRRRVQRQPDPKASAPARLQFSVTLVKMLNADELLVEFVKQYRGAATTAEAAALMASEKWHWTRLPAVTQADVDKGYILIVVTDPSVASSTQAEQKQGDAYFKTLPPAEKSAINAEVDRLFWAKTHYKPGTKLGTSAEDQRMAASWRALRQDLLRKRQAVEALPPDIQHFLFDENAPTGLDPQDLDTVLRLATKVAALTPSELDEYKSRVTDKTADWSIYEASLDRFLGERQEREKAAKERRSIETRLYGLDALYDRYRQYLSLLKSTAMLSVSTAPQAVGASLGAQPTINRERAALEADLITAGFPGGISDFEKFIREYEKAFESETLAIAKVMLDQYDHVLWEQEQRYQKRAEADALYQSLSQTTARADYDLSDKIRSEHASSVVYTPDEMAEQAYWVGQRNRALAQGESSVREVAKAHPLVGNTDFDRKRLAQASQADIQPIMLGYIAARRKDIAETRRNLKDKPTMIYGLDALLKASFQSQHIQSGTIYDKIIRNHISDVHWSEAIPHIILAVIAVAAGLLTGGGGAVAVLAAGTALGIGAYQAIEEFRRYELKSAAHGAQLTSEDPTMAWVIVAVIGAGIDAGVFLSVLPKLRPAIQAFNAGAEAGDVAALGQKLAKLQDVDEGIRNGILRAAEAEAEARAAWKAVFRPPAALRMVIVPGAEEFGRFVYAVYMSVRRGIREFQVFVKTNEAVELIGDVAKLSASELATVKTSYLQAIGEMEAVVKHGKALEMADNEIRAFMNLRGNTKSMTVEQVTKEMDAWKATSKSGIPFGFESAERFEKFKSAATSELKKLLKGADPTAEAFLQGSSVTGVSFKRHLPFDAASDLDVAVSSRYLVKQAEKLGYEVKANPRHVGPLGPDQIAELGLSKFQRKLGEALQADASAGGAAKVPEINIMLFENPVAVTKPIGASTEASRAATSLKAK